MLTLSTFASTGGERDQHRDRRFGREAGPPYHHDDNVDSDQEVVNKELSLCRW